MNELPTTKLERVTIDQYSFGEVKETGIKLEQVPHLATLFKKWLKLCIVWR